VKYRNRIPRLDRSLVSDRQAQRTAEKPQRFRTGLLDRAVRERLARLGDMLVACILIALTLPLLAFVAVAIKFDSSGPVFCRQRRLDRDGRCFYLLRFRTVMHDPERASGGLIWDGPAPETRVGQFLRYTRIEDLPQLINALRGEMTLIGAEGRPSIFAD
jgi:lipopolysaccharide/colanic/teichoic acid biosynthesis glycosyltransferase